MIPLLNSKQISAAIWRESFPKISGSLGMAKHLPNSLIRMKQPLIQFPASWKDAFPAKRAAILCGKKGLKDMGMMIDTNIILDILLRRKPFFCDPSEIHNKAIRIACR